MTTVNKILNYLFVSMIFFVGIIIPVKASDFEMLENSNLVDFNRKGSITITLTDEDDNGIKDAEISIYKVASAIEKDHMLSFVYTDELKDCEVSLDDLTIEGISKDIDKCVDNSVSGVSKLTSSEGIVKYTELDLGLYLVRQTNKVKGYSVIDSFLVMIPRVIDNKWTYDIESNPKTEIYKTMDVKVIKVWNKQNKNTKLPEYVKVQLLKGEEVIDTVTLNSDNNWNYTWEDIVKSDEYNVVEIDIPEGYTATYKNNEFTFTITNTDKLPQTGQIYLPIIILSSLGMMFILLGIFQLRRESNEK